MVIFDEKRDALVYQKFIKFLIHIKWHERIPKESTSAFIFTVIALTNFVNLSTYQRLFLNNTLFRLQPTAISEKSIKIRSAKNNRVEIRVTLIY